MSRGMTRMYGSPAQAARGLWISCRVRAMLAAQQVSHDLTGSLLAFFGGLGVLAVRFLYTRVSALREPEDTASVATELTNIWEVSGP